MLGFLGVLPPLVVAVFQTAILTVYCLFVGYTMIHGERWFQPLSNPIFGIAFFLLVFVVSAVICAGAVLGYPAWLIYRKESTRAFDIVVWTVVWCVAILMVLIALIFTGSI